MFSGPGMAVIGSTNSNFSREDQTHIDGIARADLSPSAVASGKLDNNYQGTLETE